MTIVAPIIGWLCLGSSLMCTLATVIHYLAGQTSMSEKTQTRAIGWTIAAGLFFLVAK